MDAITLLASPIAASQPVLPPVNKTGPVITLGNAGSAMPEISLPGSGQNAGVDFASIDRKRLETVQHAAQQVAIANVFIVGDKHFTIFKDVTGQYITRFTSLRDGKVTYIPEPELIRQTAPTASAVNIRV
jgi:hypothetical protein